MIFPEQLQRSETIETAINKHFAHLHGVLQNAEKRLIDKLQEQRNNLMRNLNDIQQRLKIEEDKLQSGLLMAPNAKDIISRINLKDVVPKLERLADAPCHLVQEPILDVEDIGFLPDPSIISILENHCKLEIPQISSYNLLRTDTLPEDYELEPLNAEESSRYMDDSIISDTSIMKRGSSCQSLSPRRSDSQALREGGFSLVEICHIEHPSNFYVRQVIHRQKTAKLEQMLDNYANQCAVVPNEVHQQTLYVVKNGLSAKWYRGRVTAINANLEDTDTYEVFDLDNGGVEHNVPKKRMRNISQSLMTIPSRLIKCALYDIVPKDGKWTLEACEAMAHYQEPYESVMMHVVSIKGNMYYVDLSKEHSSNKLATTASLRDFLIYSDFGTLNTAHQLLRTVPGAVRRFYREEMSLNTYYNVKVSHVESPHCVYVQKGGDNSHHLTKMATKMNAYYNDKAKSDDGIIHVPEIGIPCAAEESEGTWYRGIINALIGSRMVEVFLVDLGTKIPVKYEKIRRLHENDMVCPTQAIKVSLADIKPIGDEWSQESVNVLLKNVWHKIIRVFTFEKNENAYTVALYTTNEVNIAALLSARHLAISTGPRSFGVAEVPIITSNTDDRPAKVRNARTARTKKSKLSTLTQHSRDIGTGDPFKLRVKIIRAVSPDEIYVADPSNDDAYNRMVAKMQRYYNRYEHRSNDDDCKIDSQCAVYSARDRLYCRGKLIGFKNLEEAEVFLYDLALTETIPVGELQGLVKKFWPTPMYAFKVKLSGIYPCGGSSTWPSSSCIKLKDLTSLNEMSKFYISKVDNIEKGDLNVELWVEQAEYDEPLAPTRITTKSINEILVETGLALPIKHYNEKKTSILAAELKRHISHTDEEEKSQSVYIATDEKFTEKKRTGDEDSIRDIYFDEGSVLSENSDSSDEEDENETLSSNGASILSADHTLVSNEQKVTAWLPAEPITDQEFTAVATDLNHDCYLYLHSTRQSGHVLRYIEATLANEYGNMEVKNSDLVWNKGDLCIAQYHANKKWYRAQVCRVLKNDMIEVEFIDYGNIEDCENGTLRKRLTLVNIPRQGTKAVIYGLFPNTKSGKWRTPDLDKIHALLIDRECEINVLKRYPDRLLVSIIVTNPRRCELIKYLRDDLNMNVRTEFANFELPNDESENTLDTSDDVIIDGYFGDYEHEEKVDYKSEDSIEKVKKVKNGKGSRNKENSDESAKDGVCNENAVGESVKDENRNDKNEDEENEKSDDNVIEYIELNSSISTQFPISVPMADSETTILGSDEDVEPADNPASLTYTDEFIITGTANFTCSADEIEMNQQEAMSKLDSISLPDTICLKDDDVVSSTPCNFSFDAGVIPWKNVEIPEDVQVVKAEVAKIGLEALFMHLLDNKNSKILTDQRRLYEKTMQDMQDGANEQPVLKIFEKGTQCCAKFSDGKWYRSQVLACESDPYELGLTIKICFVDFGNEACVKSNEVRALKDEWLEAPCMALWCKLSHVVLAPTTNYDQACEKILSIYQNESYSGDKNARAFYVKIEGRFNNVFDVEIYKDEKCTELAYESAIKEGLYVKVEDV